MRFAREPLHGLILGAVLGLVCVISAAAQSTTYLPAVASADPFCTLPEVRSTVISNTLPAVQPAWRTDPSAILPVGLQLDDVGQYYSQSAPSLASQIRLANLTGATQTFSMTLYGDTGNVARSLSMCAIPPRADWSVQVAGGQIAIHNGVEAVDPGDVCADVEDVLGRKLHGIFHAEIRARTPSALDVHVLTELDTALTPIDPNPSASYAAVPHATASATVHLPGIVATRDRGNWWDTEIVVQNASNFAVDVTFQLCADSGHCFDNNRARLAAHERRLFLASHLLYEDGPNGLVEHAGWYAATATATDASGLQRAARIAVTTNFFRQLVAPQDRVPKAENGSTCLYAATQPQTTQATVIPIHGRASSLRIYNGAAQPASVRLTLLGAAGAPPYYVPLQLPAHGAASVTGSELDALAESVRVSYDRIRLEATSPVSVLIRDGSSLAHAETEPQPASHWLVPFFAAPIVPFRWDALPTEEDVQHPSSQFGIAESRPREHHLRPDWARRLTWYSTGNRPPPGFERPWCDETVGPNDPYSTYVPRWRGLYMCNPDAPNDRTCVNTPERLRTIRNVLPSSCAGRPVFLANEPDLSAQAYMTYHELGRLVYVLRDIPGQLFSPVFAGYSYDRPIHPPEVGICEALTRKPSKCPGTPGCELCVRDGVFDGNTDPFDISLQGLELYLAQPGIWVTGQSWPAESLIEGLLLHHYTWVTDTLDDNHWRVPYLHQYRERAAQAGWPIVVKEYGFAFWDTPDMTRVQVADHVDDVRRFLLRNLGGQEGAPGRSPFKIIWYHSGCGAPENSWSKLCLFSDPQTLSEPVGVCWHEDAVLGDGIERQCGQALTGESPE